MGKMFGTNGVRGVVNKDMNVQLALQMGKAVGSFFGGTVAIARDTRVSSEMLSMCVVSGMLSVGADVVDLGMIPTPALQYYVKTHDKVVAGVMITASHNPPEFNGIKIISGDGTEASKQQEAELEAAYAEVLPTVSWNEVGTVTSIPDAGEAYVDAIVSHVDAAAIRKAGFSVVVDCSNGASCFTTPLLMKKLGVRAISLNASERGEFPGHPSEPVEENLSDLKKLVRDSSAVLGIAHDGDADRCVFLDSKGKFIPGDMTLALFSRYLLRSRNEAGAESAGIVVTPVATSMLIDDIVKGEGGAVVRTEVGSPTVARRMISEGAVFGGEENGGLIFPGHQYCRDGGMAAAYMLELIAKNGPLTKLLSDFPVYYSSKRKLECDKSFYEPLYIYLLDSTAKLDRDVTDGIKLLFDDGWVLLRPSGTEPLYRIYAESASRERADELADQYSELVKGFIVKREEEIRKHQEELKDLNVAEPEDSGEDPDS